jgi:hypothetical protein
MIDHWNEQPQFFFEKIIKQGGVSQCGLPIYIKKYLKAKEELRMLKHFHHAEI